MDKTYHKKFQVDSVFGRRIIKGRKSRFSVILVVVYTTTTICYMTFYTPSRPAKTIIDRAPIIFPMLYTTCGTCHKILLKKIACMHACMHACMYASREIKELELQFLLWNYSHWLE